MKKPDSQPSEELSTASLQEHEEFLRQVNAVISDLERRLAKHQTRYPEGD